MKKNKMSKRVFSLILALFAIVSVIPVQSFASGGTYCVYEDFENLSSLSAVSKLIHVAASTTGTITLDTSKKAIKYDKNQDVSNIAFYTDIYFNEAHTFCKKGSKYVFEVTFWYEGTLDGVTSWGEFVGGRKQYSNGNNDNNPSMKCFLKINQGKLVTGDGQVVTALSPNTKYTVAIAVNDAESKYDVYLNGSNTAVQKNVSYDNSQGVDFTSIRALNVTAMRGDASTFPDFYADNIKLYYADKPVHVGGTPSMTNPLEGGGTTDGGGAGGGTTGGGTTDGGATGGGGTTDGGDTSGGGTTTTDPLVNVKLPYVKQREFEFNAPPATTNKTESDPIVLEKTKDILLISGIGGVSILVIALTIVFNKKFV